MNAPLITLWGLKWYWITLTIGDACLYCFLKLWCFLWKMNESQIFRQIPFLNSRPKFHERSSPLYEIPTKWQIFRQINLTQDSRSITSRHPGYRPSFVPKAPFFMGNFAEFHGILMGLLAAQNCLQFYSNAMKLIWHSIRHGFNLQFGEVLL